MAFPVAIIGVLINLTGGLSTAFGWAIQKYAHNEANKTNSSCYGLLKWWFGLVLVIVAQPLYIFSSALANQSTLGVVGPFSLIASLIFASFMLNEKITCWECCGIMLFVPGIILTLLFASMENNRLNQEQFNQIFYSKASMTYLGLNLVIVLIMSIISVLTFQHFESNQKEKDEDEAYENNQDVYLTGGNEYHPLLRSESHGYAIKNKDDSLLRRHNNDIKGQHSHERRTNSTHHVNLKDTSNERSCFSSPLWKWVCLIFFPYISTWLSSISTMFVRTLSGFGSAPPPLGHHSNFYGPLPYFYIFLIILCAVSSYVIINIALKYYDSVYIAPLFKIGGMLHNLLSGGVLLNEFGDYSHDHKKFAVFLAGILICIIGISLLVFGYKKSGKN